MWAIGSHSGSSFPRGKSEVRQSVVAPDRYRLELDVARIAVFSVALPALVHAAFQFRVVNTGLQAARAQHPAEALYRVSSDLSSHFLRRSCLRRSRSLSSIFLAKSSSLLICLSGVASGRTRPPRGRFRASRFSCASGLRASRRITGAWGPFYQPMFGFWSSQ